MVFLYLYPMESNSQIYGIRPVVEAVQAGKPIAKVFIQKGLRSPLFFELEALLKKAGTPYVYVPVEKLNQLAPKNHQGVVALASPVEFYDLEERVIQVTESGKTPLFLLLDGISDVRNFGAIIRTASCTGVHAIIIPQKGAAPVTADTVKTSAGAVFNVPLCQVAHLKDAVYYLQASGIQVVAATEKASHTLYELSLKEPIAILMGSEDKGINPSLLKIADKKAKLPVQGTIPSLNVSVACGIFLYEALRQRTPQ